jgi:hypothetical protein
LGCISTLPSIAFSEDNATYKMSPLVVSEGEFKQDKFVSVNGILKMFKG